MTREVWVEFGSNLYLCDWQNGGDAVQYHVGYTTVF